MRKTSKVISLLLTIAMMATMVLPMTVSAAFSDVPSDHGYYKAITNLSAEGVLNGFEDGSFKPGDPVTRAQFTKIICYALSVGTLTYSEEERSIFTDVAPEHWAANNIVTASKQGIINGMGDGTFAPEAGVQYEQAVKMVVCALGYGPRALTLGEYPAGYMNMANQLKLLKGITDAKMYEVMNRGAVAQLIDNMMNASQLQDGQQGGSIRDEVSTNKNVEGQVVAGHGVALYVGDAELDACRKNEIILAAGGEYIAYDISELNGFDIYEFLGRSVTVYYEEESGVGTQVLTNIALQNRKNETIKIDLDMIYDYDDSTIEYYTDENRDDTEIATYQTSANRLWNGQPVATSVKALLDSYHTAPGYITLVSSQSNQAADVVFLKTYDTIVVESVVTKDSKVFAKNTSALPSEYASGIILDVTDRTKNVTIKMNGSDYALSSIRTNHILSVSKDPSGKVIEVLVSTKTASGIIESMSTTPTTQLKLSNGNTIYTVSPTVYDGIGNVSGATALASLEVGKNVALSIDAFGKVARFAITAESAYNYGYIASLEDGLGTASNPELWVMIYKPAASNSTLKGQIVKFADRIKINGTNYNVDDDFGEIKRILSASASTFNVSIEGNAPTTDGYAQPIKYALDKSNQISGLITGNIVSGPGDNNNLNIINYSTSAILCKVDASTLDQYKVSSSTPVIYVPLDRVNGAYSSKTSNFFDEGKSYYVHIANPSTTNVVGCVYLYGVVGGSGGSLTETITDENKPLIVTYKSQKEHMDSVETFIKVKDILTGEEVECFEQSDALDLDTLEIGDVVRVAIGADDYVEALEVLADMAGVAAGTFNYSGNYWFTGVGDTTDNLTAEFRVLLGTVRSREGNNFVVIPNFDATIGTSSDESYTVTDSMPIYKIDSNSTTENNRIIESSIGEVIAYNPSSASVSKVLVYTVKGVAKALIIFE